MKYEYKTEGICPSLITVELNGDVIKDVEFNGGCNGNLKAISKIVQGMTVEEVQNKFSGITCGRRATSCVDQMAKAIKKAAEN